MVHGATSAGHKLLYKWVGPRRIPAFISLSTYTLQVLTAISMSTVHASHLRPIAGGQENKPDESVYLDNSAHTESLYETVKRITDVKEVDGVLHAQFKCLSDRQNDDLTWQSLQEMCEDVPDHMNHIWKIQKPTMHLQYSSRYHRLMFRTTCPGMDIRTKARTMGRLRIP